MHQINSDGVNVLFCGIGSGDLKIVHQLCRARPKLLDETSEHFGFSPLHVAVNGITEAGTEEERQQYVNISKYLLRQGADALQKCSFAIFGSENEETARDMLENWADDNDRQDILQTLEPDFISAECASALVKRDFETAGEYLLEGNVPNNYALRSQLSRREFDAQADQKCANAIREFLQLVDKEEIRAAYIEKITSEAEDRQEELPTQQQLDAMANDYMQVWEPTLIATADIFHKRALPSLEALAAASLKQKLFNPESISNSRDAAQFNQDKGDIQQMSEAQLKHVLLGDTKPKFLRDILENASDKARQPGHRRDGGGIEGR